MNIVEGLNGYQAYRIPLQEDKGLSNVSPSLYVPRRSPTVIGAIPIHSRFDTDKGLRRYCIWRTHAESQRGGKL